MSKISFYVALKNIYGFWELTFCKKCTIQDRLDLFFVTESKQRYSPFPLQKQNKS